MSEHGFAAFCLDKSVGIIATLQPTDRNHADERKRTGFAWKVRLSYQGRKLSTDFWCGTGHATTVAGKVMATPPAVADVLYSLISDRVGDDTTFAEWASDYGYSADSIDAKKTYKACIANGKKLAVFLADDLAVFVEASHDY